eukprot:1159292-Pelagomonas_calceolata.AAC.2
MQRHVANLSFMRLKPTHTCTRTHAPQICSAMVHMHNRRMMHRDLKPHNIFIAGDGNLKLGDLGLSRYFSSRTLQAMSTGEMKRDPADTAACSVHCANCVNRWAPQKLH